MKKLFILFVMIALTISVFAQAPQKMSYQAVIRNSSGQLVANHAVGMRISILQGSANGTAVYSELFNPNPETNANGLVSIEIGGGVPLTGSFSMINWASDIYFLKTETDPTGGTDYTIVGTNQLLSVPYAIYAKTAGNGTLWSQSGSNIYYNSGKVGVGISSPATYFHAYGVPVTSRGQLSLSAPAGQGTFISFYEADIFKAYLWFDASNQDLRLQNFTAGNLNLNPYGGNVGIGTNTPSAKLDVSGTIKATSFAGDGNSLTNIAVPDNSINSQKIINGTVQNEDIAANAIETNKIQDGSITAVDIADEPAVKEANSLWIKMSNTCSSLRSMSVTAPADGKLLVMATGTLSLQKSSITEAYWRLDLSTVANDCSGSVPSGSTPKSASRGNIPASWTFIKDFGLPFNIQEVYTVTKGATYNFYINGDASGFSSDVYLFHPTIVAIYIPGSL